MNNITNIIGNIHGGFNHRVLKVSCTNSIMGLNFLKLLTSEGFIRGYAEHPKNPHKLSIFMKYDPLLLPVIFKIITISKPGKRIYVNIRELWGTKYRVKSKNIYILSTNQGLLTDTQASMRRIGGEILCKII